jgi:hypothetical protein
MPRKITIRMHRIARPCSLAAGGISFADGRGKMRIAVLTATGCAVLACAMLAGGPASAQFNEFEIKEPKVEAGEVEIEYLGDYSFGQPRRRFAAEEPGEFEFDGNEFARQRHVLGLGYGLTNWLGLEVSVEFEEERFEDAESIAQARSFDDLKATEVQVEGTVVLVPARKGGVGVAFLFEHNIAIDRDEGDQLFLGTALQYAVGPWSATANLYGVRHFFGKEELDDRVIHDERWDFQYAAQVKYQVNDALALAVEGFGVVERVGDSGTKGDERVLFGDFDRHLLGPALYYSWGGGDDRASRKAGKRLHVRSADANGRNDKNGDDDDDDEKNGGSEGPEYTLGTGVLFGLNDNTSDVVLKWALSVEF